MANSPLEVKRRFKEFRKVLGITQEELANATLSDKTTISKIENEKEIKRTPSFRIAFAMQTAFGLRPHWLETGEGEMFISPSMNPKTAPFPIKYNIPKVDVKELKRLAPKLEAIPLRLADPLGFEATGQKFYTLADGSEVMQIPVVPVQAWGSYPRGYADPEFYDGFDTITIPVDKQHKGTYMSFEMKGESMVNIETKEMARKSLWPGQRIIGRDLRRESWQYKLHIHSNDAWIVVHRTDGITVKEIASHDVETGDILLRSWNPDKNEHPDFTWNLADVQQLFNVVDPFAKMRPY